MGCDIHFYVEIKNKETGRWEYHPVREKYETGEHYEDGSKDIAYDKYFKDPLYVGRNYDLFAILADVRNGRGFAGIKTGEGFNPISQPRGLPEDASPEVVKISEGWGEDGHSHSHLALAELLAFDWKDQKTTHYGTVDPKEFLQFKKTGKPESWCGGVGGSHVRKVSNEKMQELIDDGTIKIEEGEKGWDPKAVRYYTQVKWTESYANSVQHFLTVTVPALQLLGEPENVRAVFFFDN